MHLDVETGLAPMTSLGVISADLLSAMCPDSRGVSSSSLASS